MPETQHKENQVVQNLKRTKSIGEGEGSRVLREGMENRSKWQKLESTAISPMMEVARQEWPQLDK